MFSHAQINDNIDPHAHNLQREGTTVTPKAIYSKLTSFCSSLWRDMAPSTQRSTDETDAVIAEIGYSNQFINY